MPEVCFQCSRQPHWPHFPPPTRSAISPTSETLDCRSRGVPTVVGSSPACHCASGGQQFVHSLEGPPREFWWQKKSLFRFQAPKKAAIQCRALTPVVRTSDSLFHSLPRDT